jgi:hypothetical protein
MIYTALLSLKLCIGSVSKRGEIAKNEKVHQEKNHLKKEKKNFLLLGSFTNYVYRILPIIDLFPC